jgi:hypothetical protein
LRPPPSPSRPPPTGSSSSGAEEAGDEAVGRALVDLERRPICCTSPSRKTTMRSAKVIASI